MKLELFYKSDCPYCQKVLRVINKYDIDDKIIFHNINKNSDYEKRLKEEGGRAMVPCLFIDGKAMYESKDIIKYLKENVVKQ